MRGLSEAEGSEVESFWRKNTAAEPQDAKAEEGCGSSRAGMGEGRKRQGCVCLMGWACACVLCGVCVGTRRKEASKPNTQEEEM